MNTPFESSEESRDTSIHRQQQGQHEPDLREQQDQRDPDRNPDPITHAPGSHPVGTGLGAAGAGAAATVVGTVLGGPVGGAIGAVVGAVGGGYAGKAVAEAVDPTEEDAYWRDAHRNEAYFREDYDYEQDYAPAYRTGYSGYASHAAPDRDFDAAEPDLAEEYRRNRGGSRLAWEDARNPARAAWDRVHGRVGGGTPVGGGASL